MYRQLVYSPNVEIVTRMANYEYRRKFVTNVLCSREDVFADIFGKYLFKSVKV